jgi:hypothetical protein
MNRLAQRVERLEKTHGGGDEELIIFRKIIDMDGRVISCIPRSGSPVIFRMFIHGADDR